MKRPSQIYMVRPDHFRVAYAINSHMDLSNQVDKGLALKQWSQIKEIYSNLGYEVIVQGDREDLPDMVFCANTIMTFPGNKKLYSKMRHPERVHEVDLTKELFGEGGQSSIGFEAMGDLLIDYDSEKFFGGYGFRTDDAVYDAIEKDFGFKVQKLKLVDERFYHLDTCLSIIDGETAIYFPEAFDDKGLQVLKQSFQNLISVSEYEAEKYLACNAFSPDGKHVLVEAGATMLIEKLSAAGFEVISVDTSEFLKAGGSIFCMKNFGWFR